MPSIVLGCFLVHVWWCKGMNWIFVPLGTCAFTCLIKLEMLKNWLIWARHALSHQRLLILLLLLLTFWKKHRMYPQVGLCLDIACQLQGLGLLFLVQAEHVCQFLDTTTLNKCLLSMICKCVLPHVEELGSLVIWLAFKIVSASFVYDKLGYQVQLFSAFSCQYPSYHIHQTL